MELISVKMIYNYKFVNNKYRVKYTNSVFSLFQESKSCKSLLGTFHCYIVCYDSCDPTKDLANRVDDTFLST